MVKLTPFDYEYLIGRWDGPKGAAWNVVAEDCREAGMGFYGDPTAKGEEALREYEQDLGRR